MAYSGFASCGYGCGWCHWMCDDRCAVVVFCWRNDVLVIRSVMSLLPLNDCTSPFFFPLSNCYLHSPKSYGHHLRHFSGRFPSSVQTYNLSFVKDRGSFCRLFSQREYSCLLSRRTVAVLTTSETESNYWPRSVISFSLKVTNYWPGSVISFFCSSFWFDVESTMNEVIGCNYLIHCTLRQKISRD